MVTTPLIPELGRRKQVDLWESKASPLHRVSKAEKQTNEKETGTNKWAFPQTLPPLPMAGAQYAQCVREQAPLLQLTDPLPPCSRPPHLLASTLGQSFHTYKCICICMYLAKTNKSSLPFRISSIPFSPTLLHLLWLRLLMN